MLLNLILQIILYSNITGKNNVITSQKNNFFRNETYFSNILNSERLKNTNKHCAASSAHVARKCLMEDKLKHV